MMSLLPKIGSSNSDGICWGESYPGLSEVSIPSTSIYEENKEEENNYTL